MQENLKTKYGITDEELKRAVDQIPFGKIACDGKTLLAVVDLVANGDIAGTVKKDIVFKSDEHEKFYNEQLENCHHKDRWHKALLYTLGLTEDIRNHFKEVYDVQDDSIRRDSLKAGWVTGTDKSIMRLAFTLFTDYIPEEEAENYMLHNIFGYIDNRFLFQAMALRF